jgi:hypothetical protein
VCELAASESASIPCAERNWPNDSASDPYAALLVSDLKGAGGKPTSWIWDGYLAAEEITLLTSLWKSGKTTLISILLARLKDGGMLGGHRVTPGRVVMVTEEGPSMWFERSQLLPFDNHVCWFCRPFTGKPRPEEWLALLDQIGRLHDRQKIDLLVLDSLANLSPMLTENDAGEMLKALLPLQRLTRRGMAVLVSHHPRKGPVAAGQAARGSGALSGFVDIIVEMQRVSYRNAKDRRRYLRGYSRHEQTPGKWVIELTADGTDYLSLGESAEPSFERGWLALKSVLENSEGRMSRREILRAWPESALPPAKLTLWKWLDRAVKERRVQREGAGHRRDPHKYWLPGMEQVWHERFLKSFLGMLDKNEEEKTERSDKNEERGDE